MARARLIHQLPATTPADAHCHHAATAAISPTTLLREAAHRLGIAAVLGVVLWFVGAALDHWAMKVLNPGDPRWRQLRTPDAIVGLGILTSAALFAYSRGFPQVSRFLLDLGLGYLIITALDIAIIWHWDSGSHTLMAEPMFSWAACLVLIFAAIIPNPPWKTFVAGLIAALHESPRHGDRQGARHLGFRSLEQCALLMHYPDYIMVGVSVVISQVITRLGHHVTRAREMGSYRLGELLGRGGMGEVYRATHRMLARPAAIKLIRPEAIGTGSAAELALRRFRREAEVAASLRSPHTGGALRFRGDGEPDLLLRDGVARRVGSRDAGSPARAAAAQPGDPHPSPGVRFAGRGPLARPRFIATSSPPTFISAGWGCATTSSKCSTSGW